MIYSFVKEAGKILKIEGIKENALWYDFLNLNAQEKKAVEERFKIDIPFEEKKIRFGTSNTFKKGEVLYISISIIAKVKSDQTALFPITFIIHSQFLITLRYAEPKPFQTFKERLQESGEKWDVPLDIFLGLLETIFNRIAELTENIGLDIDKLSEEIFNCGTQKSIKTKKLNDLLTRLGNMGEKTAKINESSKSVERLLNYVKLQKTIKESDEKSQKIDVLQQDIKSILDHLTFLSYKTNFSLDACLGYITIEQNNIIKIFTIVAVLLLPPALIATIYGMNFKNIPELNWSFGYPYALLLMVASAILPYIYFKRKGWI